MMSSPNEIYQYSTISALTSGLASPSSSIPISTLLSHGSHGLGTFASMDGEMVVLDSTAYQFHGDGTTNPVSGDQLVPFALVSQFSPQITKKLEELSSKAALVEEVEKASQGARNAFVLFKLQGKFQHVKIRAVHKQAYSGQPLAELADQQSVNELHDLVGTVVGVRSPGWSVGVSVVGIHAHFIDEGRKLGGHILEIEASGSLQFEVSVSRSFKIEIPDSKEFSETEVKVDVEGTAKAEG